MVVKHREIIVSHKKMETAFDSLVKTHYLLGGIKCSFFLMMYLLEMSLKFATNNHNLIA